jgi:hypothetical protein
VPRTIGYFDPFGVVVFFAARRSVLDRAFVGEGWRSFGEVVEDSRNFGWSHAAERS